MLVQKVYIKDYDWSIIVYYHVTCYYINDILNILEDLDASEDIINDAYNNMKDCKLNTGITFTNSEQRTSIIVISDTSSPSQFLNSFTHELDHFAKHVCKYNDIDVYSEEASYLVGDAAKALYPVAKHFLCNCRCSHRY